MMKRICSFILALMMAVPVINQLDFPVHAETVNNSRQLEVSGNKLVYADDPTAEITLSGINLCGCEWLGFPENGFIKQSLNVALDDWSCNVIRLGVSYQGWWGRYDYVHDGGQGYREYIDDVIEQVGAVGKYIILDLHEYEYVSQATMDFWAEAAVRYKNNPAVLFGLLNEPTGITWEQWKYGDGGENIGEQALVESIRDMGAKNLLVVGGIGYASDLSGVVGENNVALTDCGTDGDMEKSGYGIMYDCHIYPNGSSTASYDARFGEARKIYPILIGEYGWDPEDTVIISDGHKVETSQGYHTRWFDELYAWVNDEITYGSAASTTAWCFHPSSSPRLLEMTDENGNNFGDENYSYPPTDFFGVYAKAFLEKQMGKNILINKTITDYTEGRPSNATPVGYAIDGDPETAWTCGSSREKELVIDLGAEFEITRWQLNHGGSLYEYELQLSTDGTDWVTADRISNSLYPDNNTDRFIGTARARYVKLYITDDTGLATVYDFAVTGRDVNSAEAEPAEAIDTSGVVSYYKELSFYKGEELGCWYSNGNYPEYIANASEDGLGKVMRLTDYGTPMLALLNDNFNDFINFDYFTFKYKSSYDVTMHMVVEYRVSKQSYTTKKVTLPSTGGEWKTARITAEELMPDIDGEWVKNSMRTIYSLEHEDYEPVTIMHMNTSGTGSADFEYIRASWEMDSTLSMIDIDFENDSYNANEGLRPGVTDISVRFRSDDYSYLNDVFVCAASYDEGGSLRDADLRRFNIAPNSHTEPYDLTVENDGSGFIKLFVWRDAEGMLPVMQTVVYDSEGVRAE